MCGFAGVVAWDDRYRVSRETLGRMSAPIAHRGPDGEGYHLNHEQKVTADRPQVGLAFRRLAILDLDPRSNQPFTDGRHWLVFNGEIYNFRELRAELTGIDPSYQWRTTGDTEVLLRSYAVWGETCVKRLNGMFAFAVWDEPDKTLFLARDRMGQKPLYVAVAEGDRAIAFASEPSALRDVSWIDRSMSPEHLASYLRWGYVPGVHTIYRGITEFPRAGWSRFDGRARVEEPYRPFLTPRKPHDAIGAQALAQQTKQLVSTAVGRQLVSDVPLGCFLSGGVDSSIIACAMRAAVPREQPVMTFAIGFDDPRYDERPYAARVAQHLGTEHHEFLVKADAVTDLPKLAAVLGEPFADSSALPTHYLSRETRRHVKVALSGDGGDELFAGYDRYRALHLSQRIPRPVRALLATPALRAAVPGSHPKSTTARIKRYLSTIGLDEARRYSSYVQLFDEPTVAALLPLDDARLPDSLAAIYVMLRGAYDGRPAVEAALATDRATYLPGDLLTKLDRSSMLHALEVRSPFMDPDVVEFASRLTTDQLLKGGPKRMLREAFAADLPDFVFKRRKMGFAVPIGEWFRGELRPMLRDHLFAADSFAKQHFNMPVVERLANEHEQERVDHSQRLYALLMLELWWRLWGK